MYHDKEVWIGTVDGYLMLYKIIDSSLKTINNINNFGDSIAIKTNFSMDSLSSNRHVN